MAANSLFTLAELADQVCINIGDLSDLTQAKARKNINRALIRFSEMGAWSWQRDFAVPVVITPNQPVQDVPNTLKIYSLYMEGANNRRLSLIGDQEFRQRFTGQDSFGAPYVWRKAGASRTVADGVKIGLYPVPDSTYQLYADVLRPISLLSADTDDVRVKTGMPSNLVDLVIEMATAIGWKEIDDAQASEQMQEASQRLAAVYADDQREPGDRFIFSMDDSGDGTFFDPVLDERFS